MDGNGILHQNGCGLACHLGVLLNIPTVGVGKTLFFIDGITKDKVKALCNEKLKDENDYVFLEGESGKVWDKFPKISRVTHSVLGLVSQGLQIFEAKVKPNLYSHVLVLVHSPHTIRQLRRVVTNIDD